MTDTRPGKHSIWAIMRRRKSKRGISSDSWLRSWLCLPGSRALSQDSAPALCLPEVRQPNQGRLGKHRPSPGFLSCFCFLSSFFSMNNWCRHLSFISSKAKKKFHLSSYFTAFTETLKGDTRQDQASPACYQANSVFSSTGLGCRSF